MSTICHPMSSTQIDVSTECQFRKLVSHKNCKKPIKCMIINCNGLKSQSKEASLCASIAHHNPDIIFGCGIIPNIATYSIFPENYSVHRKDRNSEGGGGVFIVVNETLVTGDPSYRRT